MSFTLKSVVVEEVPAWMKCERCEGKGKVGHMIGHVEDCRVCSGEGGEWATPVTQIEFDSSYWVGHAAIEITKSTILVREWTCPDGFEHTDMEDYAPCDRCTATPWRVKV